MDPLLIRLNIADRGGDLWAPVDTALRASGAVPLEHWQGARGSYVVVSEPEAADQLNARIEALNIDLTGWARVRFDVAALTSETQVLEGLAGREADLETFLADGPLMAGPLEGPSLCGQCYTSHPADKPCPTIRNRTP